MPATNKALALWRIDTQLLILYSAVAQRNKQSEAMECILLLLSALHTCTAR
jgi:hypothetical protein